MAVIDAQYPIWINEDRQLLRDALDNYPSSEILVLTDENTQQHCLPVIARDLPDGYHSLTITAGEQSKSIDTCRLIWQTMMDLNLSRNAVVINLGGGVVGDIGGFVAGTYKRGIDYIQVPTSLLAQVDASIGGKTGIDLDDHKNMIGLFVDPVSVWIETSMLQTLQLRELQSGMAEILKHALIRSGKMWDRISPVNSTNLSIPDPDLIIDSLNIKNDIVQEDPFESSVRKLLNFGHTVGHAIESFCLKNDTDIRHGEAIAAGMICEAYISHQRGLLSFDNYKAICQKIDNQFSRIQKLQPHITTIAQFCRKDKKNKNEQIMMVLLESIGKASYDHIVSLKEVEAALNVYTLPSV